MCALRDYLQNVVTPALNNNADGLAEIQQFCVEINQYCDDYIKNLDVQEDINNKFDQITDKGILEINWCIYSNNNRCTK